MRNSLAARASASLALVVLAGSTTAASGQPNRPQIGERVRIEGPVRADGSLVARRVSRRSWRAPIVIRGPVDAVGPQSASLRVLGITVSMRPRPRVDVGSPEDFRPGDVVELEGLRSLSMIQATKIRLVARGRNAPTDGHLEGDLQIADRDGYVVLGQRAWLPASAARLDDEAAATGSQAVTGRLRRDADDQQVQSLETDWLSLGGRVDGSFVQERNFALADDRRESVDRTTSGVQVLSLVTLPGGVEAFAKVKAQHRVLERDDRNVSGSIRVAEAYVSVRRIARSPASVHLGRQRFRDTRGWLYDIDLNALRLDLTGRRWSVQGAVAKGVFAGADSRRRADQRHIIGMTSLDFGNQNIVTGHVIVRDDVPRDERPVYVGASAYGRLGRRLQYRSDVVLLRGQAGRVALRGWAADVGGGYQWRSGWTPAVSLGYAVGSGTFRTTGLESSRYRLSGTRWVSYYGEVFDPDLSNLRVLTAVFSVRPTPTLSIEAIYHRYAQVTPALTLARNDLDADADGSSPEVGDEIDTIVAFRRRPLELSLVTGVFLPGPALDAASRRAVLIKSQIRVYF